MTYSQNGNIAIIGAGLSGLCLALALHQQQISCEVYESRAQPLDIGGAIMLSPNALRVLDRLGVYPCLSSLGYTFRDLYFRTDDDKLLDTFAFGSAEKHDYDGMRIYRFELIRVLLEALARVGIEPIYGKKFDRITSEHAEDGVTWDFADGTTGRAALLVGADGIHSRVRGHLDAAAVPIFTNMIGVTAAVPAAQLGLGFEVQEPDGGTPDYPLPVTIMNKKHGAFVAAPQRRDGSEVLIGKQCHFSEQPDREGWERITSDKEWCVEFLRQGIEDYPPFVARAFSDIPLEGINLWPFYAVPKLESWTSDAARVVVLGDAAHAIPPTAGQGVNQALEDVYVFARVVGRFRLSGQDWAPSSVLGAWQRKRQVRIDRVLDLNARINKRRLPARGDEKEEVCMEPFGLSWLYDVDYDMMVDEIVTGAD